MPYMEEERLATCKGSGLKCAHNIFNMMSSDDYKWVNFFIIIFRLKNSNLKCFVEDHWFNVWPKKEMSGALHRQPICTEGNNFFISSKGNFYQQQRGLYALNQVYRKMQKIVLVWFFELIFLLTLLFLLKFLGILIILLACSIHIFAIIQ